LLSEAVRCLAERLASPRKETDGSGVSGGSGDPGGSTVDLVEHVVAGFTNRLEGLEEELRCGSLTLTLTLTIRVEQEERTLTLNLTLI